MPPPAPVAEHPTRASAREVALVIEASTSFSRELLQGVSRWMGRGTGWLITVDDREPGRRLPHWLLHWNGHGLISGLDESKLPPAWRAGRRPVVHVRRRMPAAPLPGIYPDDEAAARLGMAHLVDRGLRHLAFCTGAAIPPGLGDALQRHAAALGCALELLVPQRTGLRGGRGGDAGAEAIARRLASLPKPVGVIAANDVLAVRIIEACRQTRLAVPDDVAVVGIGDDDVLCRMATPGLTSITHDHARIGEEAAAMLDEVMRGGRTSAIVAVPPAGIIIRGSSDVLAVEDVDIRRALQVIRARGCIDLSAAEVATEVRVPRRLLDRKFQRVLGRTIHDELQRTKVAEAKRLLAETDDKLLVISVRAGFAHAPQLCNVFKTAVGMSPTQYRREARSCRMATGVAHEPGREPTARARSPRAAD